MCDTFGVIGKHKIFGKNSDHSPNEIQVVEYIKRNKKSKYIELLITKIE